MRSLTGVPRLVLDPKRSPYRIFLIRRRCGLQVFAGERLFPQKDFHFEECDENFGAQGTVGKISNGIHCLRPILLTPAKNSQRDDHFCGRLSVYSYCYERGAVSLDSSSFNLGGESIRKFDFWIGIFLSGTSGSIQKSTSGSIRIYPKKSGTSGLLHHSISKSERYYLKKIVHVRKMKYAVTILNFHVVNSSPSKVRSIPKPSNIEDILDNSNTARGNTTAEQTPMVNVIIGVLQRHHENDVPTPLEFSGQRIFETTSSTTSGRQFQNATAHCT